MILYIYNKMILYIYYTSIASVGEDEKKWERQYTAGENVNKTFGPFL